MSWESEAEFITRSGAFGGVCPVCKMSDENCRTIGKSHYFYCTEHKMVWCMGWNIFDCSDHTKAASEANKEFFITNGFELVDYVLEGDE